MSHFPVISLLEVTSPLIIAQTQKPLMPQILKFQQLHDGKDELNIYFTIKEDGCKFSSEYYITTIHFDGCWLCHIKYQNLLVKGT